jgi:hypothetical protein
MGIDLEDLGRWGKKLPELAEGGVSHRLFTVDGHAHCRRAADPAPDGGGCGT